MYAPPKTDWVATTTPSSRRHVNGVGQQTGFEPHGEPAGDLPTLDRRGQQDGGGGAGGGRRGGQPGDGRGHQEAGGLVGLGRVDGRGTERAELTGQ